MRSQRGLTVRYGPRGPTGPNVWPTRGRPAGSVTRPVGRPARVQPPPETDSEDDDELQEMLHLARIQSKRSREEDSSVPMPPAKRRPVPAPRTSLMSIPTGGQSHANNPFDSVHVSVVAGPSNAAQPREQFPSPVQDNADAMQLMFAQMASIQEANRLERQQMLEAQERDLQAFIASLAAVSAKVDAMAAPRLDLRPTANPLYAPMPVPHHQAPVPASRPNVTSTPTPLLRPTDTIRFQSGNLPPQTPHRNNGMTTAAR